MDEKQMIQKSYEHGLKAFGKYNSAPANNPEFISTLPACSFGDDKLVKLRIKMYKAYTKGWTISLLKDRNESEY